MVAQPTKMAIPLFDYQRRAIAKMLTVEEGVEVTINETKSIRVQPRGGVLCEAVGMVCGDGVCIHTVSRPHVTYLSHHRERRPKYLASVY